MNRLMGSGEIGQIGNSWPLKIHSTPSASSKGEWPAMTRIEWVQATTVSLIRCLFPSCATFNGLMTFQCCWAVAMPLFATNHNFNQPGPDEESVQISISFLRTIVLRSVVPRWKGAVLKFTKTLSSKKMLQVGYQKTSALAIDDDDDDLLGHCTRGQPCLGSSFSGPLTCIVRCWCWWTYQCVVAWDHVPGRTGDRSVGIRADWMTGGLLLPQRSWMRASFLFFCGWTGFTFPKCRRPIFTRWRWLR